MSAFLHKRRPLEIWPAFVDATASLLMVVVFALMIASIGQLFLTTALSGRDAALGRLNARVAELADQLSMQTAESTRLHQLAEVRTASLETARASLGQSERLAAQRALEIGRQRDALADKTSKLASSEALAAVQTAELEQRAAAISEQALALAEKDQTLSALENEVAALTTLRDRLNAELKTILDERDDVRVRLAAETENNLAAQAQMEHLNRQVAEVRKQLSSLAHALEIAQADGELKQTTIDNLGKRLNLALASKAQQLERYRSAFFGRLRETLADYPGIRIVGDRFVLPSELFFESASDELDASGRKQIAQVAASLKELEVRIPPDLDWVLRIDGHTDARAINTDRFPSNWELSAARAIRIVRALAAHGIPSARLAATGFAEFHPIDTGDTEAAHARNRRIEIKLTSR